MIWEANSRTRGIDATDNDFDKWNVEMSEAPEMALENYTGSNSEDRVSYSDNNSNFEDSSNSDDPGKWYAGKGGGSKKSKSNRFGSALEEVLLI